jgi:hypothetical protein
MEGREDNRKYLDEVWRRVDVLEYDKAQIEKVKENKRKLKKIQLRWILLIFGMPIILSLILFLKIGIGIVQLTIVTLVFLIASQAYEYFLFLEVKRRIYYEY